MPGVVVFQNVTIAYLRSRVGLVITNQEPVPYHMSKYLHNFWGSMKRLAQRCLPSPHLHHTHIPPRRSVSVP